MTTFFLGVIAAGVFVMAVVQIGVVVFAARLARRVDRLSDQIEHEIAPMAERVKNIADNLQQASGLVTVQIQRFDRLLATASRRADETMSLVQGAIVGPLREGMAVVAALRAVMGVFRSFRDGHDGARTSRRMEEEDPLFIG